MVLDEAIYALDRGTVLTQEQKIAGGMCYAWANSYGELDPNLRAILLEAARVLGYVRPQQPAPPPSNTLERRLEALETWRESLSKHDSVGPAQPQNSPRFEIGDIVELTTKVMDYPKGTRGKVTTVEGPLLRLDTQMLGGALWVQNFNVRKI